MEQKKVEQEKVDELLRVVGEERGRHSPEEVKEAEAALRRMAGDREQEIVRKMRRNGLIAVAAGLYALLWLPAILVVFALNKDAGFESIFERPGLPFPSMYPGYVFMLHLAFATLAGAALLGGGVALRKRREWGRKAIELVLWALIVYALIYVPTAWVGILLSQRWEVVLGSAAGGALFLCSWILLFGMMLRYIRSDDVRRLCD